MSRRFTYTTCLTRGTDGEAGYTEFDVKVSFSYAPGSSETPASYASGGSPAEDPEINDIRLEEVDGKPKPWGMYWGVIPNEDVAFASEVETEIEESEAHRAAMLEIVADAEEADAERRAEAADEDRVWNDNF